MRRTLAITLLIAFAAPLLLPLFASAATPQSSLPACCRMHGAHHCTMLAPLTPGAPAFQGAPCASYPNASTAPRLATASLTAVLALTAEQLRKPAPLSSAATLPGERFASANQKRGPPHPLA